jgi:hypothetical protein
MDSNYIMGIAAIVVSTVTATITAINHKRVRSNCCGKSLAVSFDVDATIPPVSVVPLPCQKQPET